MGQELYQRFACAREIFDRAEAAVSLELKQFCFEGPEETLARTDVCQPAIFTVSAATLAVLQEVLADRMPAAGVMAGLRLGG